MNFQIREIPNVCDAHQKDRFTCPGINTFFTAAVLWGTLGPQKMFGKGGMYTWLLIGFPIGFILPFGMPSRTLQEIYTCHSILISPSLVVYYARKRFPKATILRSIHPVVILAGGLIWAPVSYLPKQCGIDGFESNNSSLFQYNISYVWPAVPFGYFSMVYLKSRYTAFWAKVIWMISCH